MPRSKKKHETNGKNGTQHVETSQQRTKRRHSQSSSDDHDNTSSESRYGYSSDRGASPHPMNYHENNVVTDITVPWLYESHSLIMLATTMILVLYFAFLHETTLVCLFILAQKKQNKRKTKKISCHIIMLCKHDICN